MAAPTVPRPTAPPEGTMKLSSFKMVAFENAVLATLVAAVNTYTAAQLEQTFLGWRFEWDGTKYVCVLAYAD